MCGIVGYVGNSQAAPILLEGLSKLEYRGYDSAGLAVRDGEKLAEVVKAAGKLKALYEKIDGGHALAGNCGIGHTRWATHGIPSLTNAHPHVSGNCTGSGSGAVESAVVGVHNGIIENYLKLKEELLAKGHEFTSETDTEVVAHLLEDYYEGDFEEAVKKVLRVIRGSYALAFMCEDQPDMIICTKKDNPLVIGLGDGENFIASDVPAILKHARQVYYIDNMEFAKVTAGNVDFYDLNGDEISKEPVEITWDAGSLTMNCR